MDLTVFSKKLKRLTFESNRTQRSIAEELGVSECVYSRMIHGHRAPTLDQFIKLAGVFGCKMEDFLD